MTEERYKALVQFVKMGGDMRHSHPLLRDCLDEINRQRKVITKELTENDDYGAEYSFVLCCKEEIRRLRAALELIMGRCGLPDASEACRAVIHTAKEALK